MSKASTRRRLAAINGVLSEAVPSQVIKQQVDRMARNVVDNLPAGTLSKPMDKDYLLGLLTGFAMNVVTTTRALDTFDRES